MRAIMIEGSLWGDDFLTIKRRLFISNIMMIVLPIILTIVMVLIITVAFFGITGINPVSLKQRIATYIHQSDTNVYLQSDNYTQTNKDVIIYKSDDYGYLIILPDDVVIPNNFSADDNRFIPLMILPFLVTLVYLINRALTRYVFRSIMAPINTLVDGVHQIRDGNLTYRIEYMNNDEFTAVCEDFNEMAARLLVMVDQRQKDEANRRELIAGISHDLRTPLTSIKAYIEGLQKGVASTPEAKERYFRIISGKVDDMEHIINQLFLFSKLEIGDFPLRLECVEIGEVIRELLSEMASEYEKRGLSISFTANPNKIHMNLDVVQFRNLLQNIFENSIRYKVQDTVLSEVVYGDNGEDVVLVISDNGPGVPAESLNRLFDVFYRSDVSRKDPSSGSGLGLAITRKMIERFNGSIHAEKAPTGGLAIVMKLPIAGGTK